MRIMCLTIALTLTLLLPVWAEMRNSTSTSGTSIQAEYVKVETGRVYLKKTDGKMLTIPVTALIATDQAYIRSKIPRTTSPALPSTQRATSPARSSGSTDDA